jgi:hypothetical protein
LREFVSHFGFHFFGSFKLYRRRMSSSKGLVDLGLFQQLLNPRQVFVSRYAGSGGEPGKCRPSFTQELRELAVVPDDQGGKMGSHQGCIDLTGWHPGVRAYYRQSGFGPSFDFVSIMSSDPFLFPGCEFKPLTVREILDEEIATKSG